MRIHVTPMIQFSMLPPSEVVSYCGKRMGTIPREDAMYTCVAMSWLEDKGFIICEQCKDHPDLALELLARYKEKQC